MAELLQTTLCYLEQNGCYLMLHRIKKKNDVNHDKWIGVGGKFVPGETAEACALREVWEETGLTMQSPTYRGIVDFTCEPWPAERMHLYTCTDFTGTLTDCNEGTLEWVPKPEVENLPIWQGDKIFLRLLAEGAPFFHLELTYHGDTLVQAVCSMDGKVVEAVLYPGNKGLQAEGLSLSASAPCAVLIREEAGEIVVSVTDACMNAALKGIRIVLNGREIKVPMPQGMLCGKPAVIRVDRMTNQ